MITLILVVVQAWNETVRPQKMAPEQSGRRLEWYKFRCHQGGNVNLRVGFVVDEKFLAKYSSKQDCEKKLRVVGKKASDVYENNFGFGLAVAYFLFPTDLPSCAGNGIANLASYSKQKLKDKPVSLWVYWTSCDLYDGGKKVPGLVARIGSACSGREDSCGQNFESDMILVHEIGHLVGAKHSTGSGAIMQSAHEYKGERGQFHEAHEREMCAVIDKAKGKDRCWSKPNETPVTATPPSVTAATPPSVTTSTPPGGTSTTPSSGTTDETPPGETTDYTLWIVFAVVACVLVALACFFLGGKTFTNTANPVLDASRRRRRPMNFNTRHRRSNTRRPTRFSSRRRV